MKKASSQKGFSLVEVLVATLFLATVAVSLFRVATGLQAGSQANNLRSHVAYECRGQLEWIGQAVRQDNWNLPWAPYAPGPMNNKRLLPNTLPGALPQHQGEPNSSNYPGETINYSYVVNTVNQAGDGGGQDYRRVVITGTF